MQRVNDFQTVATGVGSILDTKAAPTSTKWAWVLAISTHTTLVLAATTLVAQPVVPPPPAITETAFIDIEPEPEPEPKLEPEPEIAPEPEVVPPSPHAPKATKPAPTPEPQRPTPEPPPPQAAQAGQVLTQDSNLLDLSNTVVVGSGAKYAGGITDANGKSARAVREPNARGSANGGSGNQLGAVAAPNKSRPPQLAGGGTWSCPFPPEADLEDINQAVVSLQVAVAANGAVSAADVRSDPGYGFGRAARRCALTKRWDPGLNAVGQPTAATAVVKVRFQR